MNSLAGRRIVLVGGAGFIGHHLALKFKELGAEAFVIDSLAVNNYYSIKNLGNVMPNGQLYLKMIEERLYLLRAKDVPLIELDSRDYHQLSRTITEIYPDTIIHLAAVAHADRSNKDPYSTFDHSLRTLENSLDIARSGKLSITHFIYFSSSMIYGNFSSRSVTEDSPCEPVGIYGALKLAGEKIVIAYNQVFGLPYTIVRPSALYGPRCVSRRVGQIFIENALQGLGNSIHGDQTDSLDFTYIEDLVSGVVNILANGNSKNQIFNLTYGEARSIAEMAAILTTHFPEVTINTLPKDSLVPKRGTLCIDKARKLIGYGPQYPLERGFVEYINWYKEFFAVNNSQHPY